MINSIQIQNFQSHEDSELEFSPGVNAIVGLSDAGKSSIIRSLRWAIKNRPAGESLRSDWGGDTEVYICLSDKNDFYTHIKRVRNNKKNSYICDIDQTDQTGEFKAIKFEVPEEIRQVLNLSNINLQQQHDRAFLLTNSSGEVAQHFNRIADLEAIDTATKQVRSALREHEQNIKAGQAHLEGLNESLAEFTHLDEYEIKIIALERLAEEFIQIEFNSIHLKALYKLIEQTEIDITECQKLTRLEEPVSVVLQLYKHLKAQIGEVNALQNSIRDIEETAAEVEQTKKKLKRLRKEFKENFPDVCPLCGQEVKK